MMRMFAGAHGNIGEDALWRLYEAQTLWDEVGLADHHGGPPMTCWPSCSWWGRLTMSTDGGGWWQYMAESASNYIKQRGGRQQPQQSMVVMAGAAHIENRYGVPDRISR